jgi:ring-1,2-phenylacetyl-CoA epoxidase subunit PaaE
MSIHFHALRVKELIRETSDCVSICFDIPENIQDQFSYREGQNITIKKTINGEEVRRSYSICAAPHEQTLKVAVKKVQDGLFSTYANEELRVNDMLDVMPPTGRFTTHDTSTKAPAYLAVAAGSGITPVISIIKHTLHSNPDSSFTLIYGNQNRSSIIFFEELERIKNKYLTRFNLINILSRERMDAEIQYGRIDAEKMAAFGKLLKYSQFEAAFLCGPEKMIFDVAAFLEEQGIKKDNIHFELFAAAGSGKNKSSTKEQAEDIGPKSKISVRLDGRTFDFDLAFQGKSILDAALQQGADLPFACKGGVCCTCRAKLLEGQVKMDVNYALEKEEVEQGFILTCQSHPLTDKVVIDFDQK